MTKFMTKALRKTIAQTSKLKNIINLEQIKIGLAI